MELPRYNLEFNSKSEKDGFDGESFESNAKVLIDNYCSYLPSLREHMSLAGSMNADELMDYNESVAQVLYGPRVLELFKSGDFEKITSLSHEVRRRLLEPKEESLDGIDLSKKGLIVIRPEARFLDSQIIDFIEEYGCEILKDKELEINTKQYWAMYNDGFVLSSINDFPTRTLTYTSGDSRMVIFSNDSCGEGRLQECFNDKFKGRSGVKSSEPTIRGTIVKRGFEEAKKGNSDLFYSSLDPIGMYRAIVSGKINTSDEFSEAEDPFMFYAGQGVHIPDDSEELYTCLGVLLSKEDIQDLR